MHLERWQRDFCASVDANECVDTVRVQCLTRSQSWATDTHMVFGTLIMPGEPVVAIMDRRMSCPLLTRHENHLEVFQPFT